MWGEERRGGVGKEGRKERDQEREAGKERNKRSWFETCEKQPKEKSK